MTVGLQQSIAAVTVRVLPGELGSGGRLEGAQLQVLGHGLQEH